MARRTRGRLTLRERMAFKRGERVYRNGVEIGEDGMPLNPDAPAITDTEDPDYQPDTQPTTHPESDPNEEENEEDNFTEVNTINYSEPLDFETWANEKYPEGVPAGIGPHAEYDEYKKNFKSEYIGETTEQVPHENAPLESNETVDENSLLDPKGGPIKKSGEGGIFRRGGSKGEKSRRQMSTGSTSAGTLLAP